jgi:pimeloyl-ACP methyl ester carboxylesterase
MEAGYRDVGDTWHLVQPEVARHTQACSYDRVGLGGSDPGQEHATALDAVRELKTLLTNAGIEAPYILVGHSLGGMYMRLYADLYSDEVLGLVLVDSSHPESFSRNAAILPTESPEDSESMKFYREWFNNTSPDPTLYPHLFEFGSLGDLPLIVLTSSYKKRAEDFPVELSALFDQIWVELHGELAQLSSNTTHILTAESGHFIHQDQPELVIKTRVGHQRHPPGG